MLYEKYRPKEFKDILGQEKVVKLLELFKSRNDLPGVYWIEGQSGTGKTTLAWIVARETADSIMIEEIDAAKLAVSDIEKMEREWIYGGLSGKPGRVYIVNEGHALRSNVVTALLTALERRPKHVTVIFTSTNEGTSLFEDKLDATPLLSRCRHLKLARRDLAEVFAQRAESIAKEEGLDGKDSAAYLKLVRNCGNNFRMVLSHIESGEMMN